jgi:hypothetical protein
MTIGKITPFVALTCCRKFLFYVTFAYKMYFYGIYFYKVSWKYQDYPLVCMLKLKVPFQK